MFAFLETAVRQRVPLVIPAPVLAQVWRGDRNALVGRLLKASVVELMTEQSAMRAGVLCATAGTSDVVDAAVIAGAAHRGDSVLTTDPDDLRRLAAAARIRGWAALGPIININDLPPRR